MRLPIDESKIPDEDKNPTVLLLLEIIWQQAEQIQQLKDEIARLKNQPPRPKINPSSLENKAAGKKKRKGKKRAGSKKRKKTAQLQIHETVSVPLENIPQGAEFKGYNPFVVQGLKIKVHNTNYLLATYQTAEGKYICSQLPEHLNGKHFSPELVSYILYQYYHCGVTQPLLLEQLREFEIDISKGQLSNILIEGKEAFHKEKDRILAVGLEVSNSIHVSMIPVPGITAKTDIAPISAMNRLPGLKAPKAKAASTF